MKDHSNISITSTEELQIEGSDGNDRINGSDGNDIINSGNGDDTIDSGAGDDTINGGRGLDILNGGAGTDVLALFDLNRGDENIGFIGEADNFTFLVDGADEGTFLNIESVKFDNGEVVSTADLDFTDAVASSERLQIEGSDGNDRINGSDGNDIINSGNGDDTIDSGAGDDTINGGRGLDILNGGAGTDVLALFDLNRGDENIGFIGEADNFTFLVDGADEGTFLNIESVRFDNGEVVSTADLDFTDAIASSNSENDTSDITMLPDLPPGSNERLRAPLEFPEDVELDDIEVFLTDFALSPNELDARHYHPGQNFLYVVEGSAEFKVDGEPDEIAEAGDAKEIPYERKHSARGTEEGARVIGFSVHEDDRPEKFLVEDHEHEDHEHEDHEHEDHEHGDELAGADIAIATIEMNDPSSTSGISTNENTSDIAMLPELPPSGSKEILRSPLESPEDIDDIEVVVSDVIIPPNGAVPRHYHPGEEFLYILEGSTEHIVDGEPYEIIEAGDGRVIPYERRHEPRATEEGARVLVFRVHEEGQPERILVEDHEHGENHEHGDELAGADFATINLTDLADQTVEFTVSRDAGFDDTIGFYEVNEDGSVQDPISGQTIAIGEEGYQDAALANSLDFTLSTGNGETSTFTTDLAGGTQYATFLIADGGLDELLDEDSSNDPSIYFDTAEANASGFDYIRTAGSNTFEYEDLTYGTNGVFNDGTPDYNDMVVEYDFI